MGDVAVAMQEPKSRNLMKKLSFLLHPKKSKSKSGSSSSQKPPSSTASTGSELELLFAQAEATLGELLVRAGASFEARSSSYSHADQHPPPHPRPSRSTAHDDDVSALISSGSRSAKFSGQGHARRRSLSRVWQQLGGSLFCGSGHMRGYVMDQDMMPPEPANGVYEDVVLDEAYWQSLADAMLLQQSNQPDAKVAAAHVGAHELLSCRATKEVQNDAQPGMHGAEHQGDRESEIVPSMDAPESMGIKLWPECGSNEDMDSMCYRNLVGVESGTRLNTTLDESPNLAHNYHHMKVGGATSASCPQVNSHDEVQVPLASSSSSLQPLERFLRQAAAVSESSVSSRSAPELFTFQDPAGLDLSGTISCRVSLMTLLHEEAAAADSTTTLEVRPEEEEAATAAAADEEEQKAMSMRGTMQVGEDPLLCCVCMIRRKGAALIPCGHTFCRICAKQLFAGRGACPLCNNLIVQVLDIF